MTRTEAEELQKEMVEVPDDISVYAEIIEEANGFAVMYRNENDLETIYRSRQQWDDDVEVATAE